MLVTVVEDPEHTFAAEALDLDLKRIDPGSMDLPGVHLVEGDAFVSQILICLDLILLISPVVIEHTDLKRYHGSVSHVPAYHIYIPVVLRNLSHNPMIEQTFEHVNSRYCMVVVKVIK